MGADQPVSSDGDSPFETDYGPAARRRTGGDGGGLLGTESLGGGEIVRGLRHNPGAATSAASDWATAPAGPVTAAASGSR